MTWERYLDAAGWNPELCRCHNNGDFCEYCLLFWEAKQEGIELETDFIRDGLYVAIDVGPSRMEMGRGETQQEAILDLMEQIFEKEQK